jgi:beta-phosphoglucomutase-like phosphatase (HAD superfamily)
VIRWLTFDFAGLMVDTETAARDAWLEIYREYAREFPYSRWLATLGGSGRDFDACVSLAEQTDPQFDPTELRARRWRRKLELVAARPLMPGIAEYLAESIRRDLKNAWCWRRACSAGPLPLMSRFTRVERDIPGLDLAQLCRKERLILWQVVQ